MQADVNLIAVVAAAVASFIIGYLWYSPMLFGKKWMESMGMKMDANMPKGDMMKPMVITFILSIVTAFVLAKVLIFMGASSIEAGCLGAFWIWLGFMLPTGAMNVLFEKKNFTTFLIGTSHQLVNLIIMGIILVVMG